VDASTVKMLKLSFDPPQDVGHMYHLSRQRLAKATRGVVLRISRANLYYTKAPFCEGY